MKTRIQMLTVGLLAASSLCSAVATAANPNCQLASGRRPMPTALAHNSHSPTAAKSMKRMTKLSAQGDIVQTAVGPGMQTVTTLVKAVQAAELVDALRSEGPFTVFAPTNDAFAKLPAGTVDTLLKPENKDRLRSILLYHVHSGSAIRAADLEDRQLSTVNGQELTITRDGPTVTVNDATITKTDVTATNGVIHWIDTVILPSAMRSPEKSNETATGDIVQTAVGPGMQTVTTLVKAVQAAGLVDALRGQGPFTVFAPTNDAFAKLPSGTIEALLKPENKERLQSILLYHVHGGNAIPSTSLQNGRLSTLQGKPITIKIDGPTVMVENATVTKTDVIASNGRDSLARYGNPAIVTHNTNRSRQVQHLPAPLVCDLPL